MAGADESDFDEGAETYSSASSSSEEEEEEEEQYDRDDQARGDLDEEDIPQAPSFKIPSRTISAVEHPFMVKNLDKGLASFGPNPQFQSVREKYIFYYVTGFCIIILIPAVGSRSWKSSAFCATISSPPRSCVTSHNVSLLRFSQRCLQDHRAQEDWPEEEERK